MQNKTILELNGLSASYGDTDAANAIDDISLAVKPGEILCIVGESGSGKSTLIRAIHGMSDLVITGGSIVYEGQELSKMSAPARRSLMGTSIGLIPQNPAASFNPIRKYDVQFREAMAGHDMPYDEKLIVGILARIGLGDGRSVLRSRPYELSGGMNQRIAIAAAMLFEPQLLLCDEVTSALDVTTAGAVTDELIRIREENGIAILFVTHHLGIARRMADNIGIMRSGRLVEYGRAEAVFTDPQNEYTRNLMRDVPRLVK